MYVAISLDKEHGNPCTCLVQNSFGVLVQYKINLAEALLFIDSTMYKGKVVKRLGDIADPHGWVRLKCGRVEDARRVFDDLPNRDIVTWNSMVLLTLAIGRVKNLLGFIRSWFWRPFLICVLYVKAIELMGCQSILGLEVDGMFWEAWSGWNLSRTL